MKEEVVKEETVKEEVAKEETAKEDVVKMETDWVDEYIFVAVCLIGAFVSVIFSWIMASGF